jgi:hypothetical protein
MVAREELLRVNRAKAGLVLPIPFWDGEHFPKDAQDRVRRLRSVYHFSAKYFDSSPVQGRGSEVL